MGFRDKIKINKVDTNFSNYMHLIQSKPKVGKTTLVFNICKELSDRPDSVLILSIGNETGTEALPNAATAEIENWSDFEDAINFLLNEEHNFNHVSIDTINELVKLSQREIERQYYKETGEFKNISATYSGYNAGHRMAQGLIDDVLTKLKRSPLGVWCVGHLKVKTNKVLIGEPYDVITSDLRSDYYGVFEKKATIVGNILTDPTVESGEKRKIFFRTTDKIEAGSRIETLPTFIEYGGANYVHTVTKALEELNAVEEHKGDYDVQPMNAGNVLSESKTLKEEVDEEQFLKDTISEIMSTTITVQSKVDEANEQIMKVLTDNNVKDPNKIEDKELAEKVLNDLKGLL